MAASHYTITSIDKDEVLRYLGHAGQAVSDDLLCRIGAQAAQCLSDARPRGVVRVFEVAARREVEPAAGLPAGCPPACDGATGTRVRNRPSVALRGSGLALGGDDISRHLDGALAVGVMAVTLGAEVDRRLRLLAHTSPFDQVVYDACATALAERAADAAESELVAEAAARGLFPNWRYSPGYGDFDVDVQPDLLRTLDAARQIGLTVADFHLLVPTKSVTAVLGMFAEPQASRGTLCSKCHCYDFCTIRTTGRTCRG